MRKQNDSLNAAVWQPKSVQHDDGRYDAEEERLMAPQREESNAKKSGNEITNGVSGERH